MEQPGSITILIADLAPSDSQATRHLWDHYFHRLVAVAKQQLHRRSWGGVDGDDVALSALNSFIHRRAGGDYPAVGSRDDLWKLLAVITRRKALNVIRSEMAQRRGGGQTTEHSSHLITAICQDPTPHQALEVLDEANRLLNQVLDGRDPKLRKVAMLKLEGADSTEIARQLSVSRRTVERKLEVIRLLWQDDLTARGIAWDTDGASQSTDNPQPE